MNYYEFLEWYHLQDSTENWEQFIDYRNIADVFGESEAKRTFIVK